MKKLFLALISLSLFLCHPLNADVKVGSFAAPTSTGNDAVTGVGFAPKFVIFWTGNLNAFGDQSIVRHGIGLTDGSGESFVTVSSDSVASQAAQTFGTTAVIQAITGLAVVELSASIVSLDADGFTLNWGTVEGTTRRINYLAIGGSAITNVEAGNLAYVTGSADHVETLTGSFQPDCIIVIGEIVANQTISLGAATGSGTGNQWAIGARYRDGDTRLMGAHWDTKRVFIGGDDSAIPQDEVSVKSFNATGFTLQKDVGTGALSMGYIAIKGGDWITGSFQSPTTATTKATTGLAFDPEGVLFAFGHNTDADHDTTSEPFGFGAMDSASESAIYSVKDIVSNTVQSGYTDTKVIQLKDEAGTTIEEADFSSLGSGSFEVSYSTAESQQNRVLYLAISGTAAATNTSLRRRR